MCRAASGDGAGDPHRRLGGEDSLPQDEGVMQPCSFGTLIHGWGVPTATDISLAWMFAVMLFGAGHPAINYLLRLAVVDDALGMVIIAVAYKDPNKPLRPMYMTLVVASILVSAIL